MPLSAYESQYEYQKIVSASREDQANSATDIMNYKHNINIEKKNNSH